MYTLQTIRREKTRCEETPLVIKSKPTSMEHVYLSYLRCVADNSQLDLRLNHVKTTQHVLKAMMDINDISVRQYHADPVDTLNVIKLFAEDRPDKSIIVYTDKCVYTFDLLKRMPNVTPVKYGDEFYSHIIHMPIDYIILLPQNSKTGNFDNIVQIAQQLSDNQKYIPITRINIIGMGANLDTYTNDYTEYVNAASGKITIKNKDGEDSIIEIK